eukprot:TRINITY_DN9925_c0_g1_i1.p2 TRINITY_DN9925_c0_g1~~TRINITY_DN9925_c0_g1_i1.p2  ORF type:complete len:126 (+),score=16.95 TRINITY_DN9925_c0_g1_i1:105-482(+)
MKSVVLILFFFFFFQAEDGIRDVERSRGLGDVYKRQRLIRAIRRQNLQIIVGSIIILAIINVPAMRMIGNNNININMQILEDSINVQNHLAVSIKDQQKHNNGLSRNIRKVYITILEKLQSTSVN